MKIYELIWPEDRIEHIAHHHVTPQEVEEVCFGRPLIQHAKPGRVGTAHLNWLAGCEWWAMPTLRNVE